MTLAEQIIVAVKQVIGGDLEAEFTRDELRRQINVTAEVWKASFGPIFQGMRSDQPGNAPRQAAKHADVFRRVRYGVYVLTDAGKLLVLGATPTPSPALPLLATPNAADGSRGGTLEFSAAEGRELMRTHRVIERDRSLVRRKKNQVLAERRKLECAVCGFDFAVTYGTRGERFAECHHTQPLAELRGERWTTLGDLQVVCANCHRMLHIRPLMTVEELRALVQDRRRHRGTV